MSEIEAKEGDASKQAPPSAPQQEELENERVSTTAHPVPPCPTNSKKEEQQQNQDHDDDGDDGRGDDNFRFEFQDAGLPHIHSLL